MKQISNKFKKVIIMSNFILSSLILLDEIKLLTMSDCIAIIVVILILISSGFAFYFQIKDEKKAESNELKSVLVEKYNFYKSKYQNLCNVYNERFIDIYLHDNFTDNEISMLINYGYIKIIKNKLFAL